MSEGKRRLVRSNGVEIDPAIGVVRRNGEEIYLRSKTHQLLVCLMDRREGPVAKEDLLRQVWDGAAVSDATIFGCIQELRKSLGDDARDPVFIRTMPKKGYWFVAPVEEVLEVPEGPVAEPHVKAPVERRSPKWWLIIAALVAGLAAAGYFLRTTQRSDEPHYGELAWWKLDEGQGKSVTEALNGMRAELPAGVSWVPGISGSALHFEGTDVVVRGVDPSILPRGDAPRTLMAWVKTNSTNADSTIIFRYGDPAPNPSSDSFFLVLHGTGRAGFWHGIIDPMLGPRVDDGQWHQLAGVFEGSPPRDVKLYVDGLKQARQALLAEPLKAGGRSEWVIGRAPWGGTTFRGDIDEIRIFDRPLNDLEVRSLYRCGSGMVDLNIEGRGAYFFSPIFQPEVEVLPAGEGEMSSRVRNSGLDNSGVAFVRREPGCSMQSVRAGDVGQDLRFSMDLKIRGSAQQMAEGGPYFRSRKSAPGDGIMGGTSAGYWVQLQTDGQVRVKRLYPGAIVAFSKTPSHFDTNAFHHLEVDAKGEWLQVRLDGQEVLFDAGGSLTFRVHIPPAWETADPPGTNRGCAGIAFGCYRNRGIVGGQEARNIRIIPQ